MNKLQKLELKHKWTGSCLQPPGGGGTGNPYFLWQMIKCGQKKIPRASQTIKAIEIECLSLFIHCTILSSLSHVWVIQTTLKKKLYLNQATQIDTCQIFLPNL